CQTGYKRRRSSKAVARPPCERSDMPSTEGNLEASAVSAFAEAFSGAPAILGRAPGRVELLGNHTDYNGGLVLAAAIDRETVVVGRATEAREASVRSANMGQEDRFPIDEIEPSTPGEWGRYVRGVAWAMQGAYGPLGSGFEAEVAGDVPIGAGL